MLATLAKIGEQLLQGKGVWARLTTEPKYDPKKKNWVCPIIFDCVNEEIRVLKEDMELFRPEESVIQYRYINTELWGRRGRKCALAVERKNFTMLDESLFGKEDGDTGSMLKSIADISEMADTPLCNALSEINEVLSKHRTQLELTRINISLELGKEDDVVLFYAVIKSRKFFNQKVVRLSELEEFDSFIIEKFGSKQGGEGLDQLSGNMSQDVVKAKFQKGYNPNAIFQTTTLNYASGFKDFQRSFQIDNETISFLERGAGHALRNMQTKLAGVSHVVIPNFRYRDLTNFNLGEVELFLDKTKDMLFGYQALDNMIERKLPPTNLFWINYIAFESDGNSFKIMNHIKDVNSYYLAKLTESFVSTGIEFEEYIGGKFPFNLQAIYNIIPVRDGTKSKVNPCLALFKNILEQKQLNINNLYAHFIDLALCHWYGRHAAYGNMKGKEKVPFDFAIKDAVFKYSALIYALKQLNLLDMEKITTSLPEAEKFHSDSQLRILAFFEKMNYTEAEKALFYLGRVLDSVGRAQYDKLHKSKPVLKKVNYNGMDSDAIIRLSLDLREKTRQYDIIRFTDPDFTRFTSLFNPKQWPLSEEQNVFYLMAGYSFRLTKSDNNQ